MNTYQGNTGYGEAQLTPTKEPIIRKKLGALDGSLELLEKSIMALQDRLAPVLSSELPAPTNNNKDSAPQGCQMADQLQAHIQHSEFLRDRIDTLISRLEV